MMALPLPFVKGNCPMGCGQTLFVNGDGHITCSFSNCPKPFAASCLLEYSRYLDSELIEGAVDFCSREP